MATVEQITKAVRDITRTRSFLDAEKRLDFWAVVLCGTAERVPRYFGDNEGHHPVSVGTTQNPKAYARNVDNVAGHTYAHVPIDWVWTLSQSHALRLQQRLDEMLLGAENRHRLRGRWRDLEEPKRDWPILLADAISQWPEEIEVFDDQAKMMRTLHEARRRARG